MSVFAELLESSYPKVSATVKESINPNDTLSSKAVDLQFYDENRNHIGEGSVSAIDTDNAFMYNLEVFSKYRGKGYGNSIVSYILAHYKVTDVTVEIGNDVAISLYKKFGFKKIKNFRENGRSMILMQRRLR